MEIILGLYSCLVAFCSKYDTHMFFYARNRDAQKNGNETLYKMNKTNLFNCLYNNILYFETWLLIDIFNNQNNHP